MGFLGRLLPLWGGGRAEEPAAPAAPTATAPQAPPEAPPPALEFSGPAARVTATDYALAAAGLGVSVAALRAVAEVECAGKPFLPDGRPTILFEAHVFQRETKASFAGRRDRRGVLLSSPKWDRALYGKSGEAQYFRLHDAMDLDRRAALASCSWGGFQIMGQNHAMCGFGDVESFVAAMVSGEAAHLDAFCAFVRSKKLVDELKRLDWAGFARAYNGPAYAANKYDARMAAAHKRHTLSV